MGMFDSVLFTDKDNKVVELQFKTGECSLRNYHIGEPINDFLDGVHFCLEGYFVVYTGIIVAAFAKEDNSLYSKWGDTVDFPSFFK
jgi:hypothetical protein